MLSLRTRKRGGKPSIGGPGGNPARSSVLTRMQATLRGSQVERGAPACTFRNPEGSGKNLSDEVLGGSLRAPSGLWARLELDVQPGTEIGGVVIELLHVLLDVRLEVTLRVQEGVSTFSRKREAG